MAQLVSIIGVSHSPFLPNIFRKYPDIPENDRKSFHRPTVHYYYFPRRVLCHPI